ncbi:MAG: DUF1326 domain-containing protein [Actinomycetota bacterium]|nr:DUF1326 domain-containing protein [Actinomycetota bacterium]
MTIRASPRVWRVEGSYFEACNCEAICPCRRHGDYAGGRSTFGVCDFALSWSIREGDGDGVDLRDLGVVLAGSYGDDEPGSPWRVVLYVDDRADEDQASVLADIFLGRAGGTTFENYAAAIGEVYAIRTATIRLAKASGSGEYLASDPLSGQSNNIWGVPTLVTSKLTQGTALVANLASAAVVFVRESPRLETFIGGSAEFAANVRMIRAEERLALTVVRPAAIVKVTGL